MVLTMATAIDVLDMFSDLDLSWDDFQFLSASADFLACIELSVQPITQKKRPPPR
jgi:hypothetical protein